MAAFGKADFMALYQGDIAVLGNELVVRDEFVLQPGESRPYPRTLAPDTRFIGLLGIFRDIERAVWRASVAVQPGRPLKLAIRADALAVSMTVTP
jgi:type VI secretion system protein VasD